ncbi:hypothetical protein AAFF_G00101730 [Aldrovandia affinis]|uniref:Uncharacterized protein n=1 Tax=Aldrovandia affinis TaxID=143900 RepID=A0AAD7WB35_9TELE|nr:hypothetical protein AAFF_G00101730 [Aldrovandia affinis]
MRNGTAPSVLPSLARHRQRRFRHRSGNLQRFLGDGLRIDSLLNFLLHFLFLRCKTTRENVFTMHGYGQRKTKWKVKRDPGFFVRALLSGHRSLWDTFSWRGTEASEGTARQGHGQGGGSRASPPASKLLIMQGRSRLPHDEQRDEWGGRAHTQQGGESCHGRDQSGVKQSSDPGTPIQWERGLAAGSERGNFHGLVETLFWRLKGEHSTEAASMHTKNSPTAGNRAAAAALSPWEQHISHF